MMSIRQAGGGGGRSFVAVRQWVPALNLVLLVSCGSLGFAQAAPGPVSDPPLESMSPRWRQAIVDTGADAAYLTETERQVVLELNKARTDPAEYAKRYLVPLRQYFRGRLFRVPGQTAISTNEGIVPLDECITELQQTRPLAPLEPRKGLSLAARDHAKDQGKTGATGHTGKDGSTAVSRINRYGTWDRTAGENIDYGNGTARMIVVSLLVDDGVPSRGHRRNLLDKAFTLIGVAVGPHPVYRHMCVMDFAGAYR